MPNPTKSDAPDLEQQIKTLSFRQATFMLLRFSGLPTSPQDVDQLIRHLARQNKRRRPKKPPCRSARANFQIDYSE